jgi:hypothetical protein
MHTNFPDKNYLEELAHHLEKKVGERDSISRILASSGALLNSIGDFIADKNIRWEKKEMNINDLWLTGTNPEWNEIIIKICERSPEKLRGYIKNNAFAKNLFSEVIFSEEPILVRYDEEKYKILDGMHRVVAGIRDGRERIFTFVAYPKGNFTPSCEPHVVYDIIRAYQRKLNPNKEELICALRFLRKSYANVGSLLRERFSIEWLPDEEMQEIFKVVLEE